MAERAENISSRKENGVIKGTVYMEDPGGNSSKLLDPVVKEEEGMCLSPRQKEKEDTSH